MFIKIYEKVKEIIKENKGFFIVFIVTFLICNIELPYYIEAPGGIINISERLEIETKQEITGSLNMAYVSEYKAVIPTMIMAKLNSEWNIIKKNTKNKNEIDEAVLFRNNILLDEADYNATKVALKYTDTPYIINNQKLYVTYIMEEAKTTLKVGDEITEVNGNKITSKSELQEILNNSNEKLNFKVNRDNKEIECEAKLITVDNRELLGIAASEVGEINSNPTIKFKFSKQEAGPSGGLMMSLAIYNALTENDITQGRKIVGTGTIDENGIVGSIDGVEYKLKGAVKENADIFLVPTGENYDEAIKIAEKNGYTIKILEISTFEETINLLQE